MWWTPMSTSPTAVILAFLAKSGTESSKAISRPPPCSSWQASPTRGSWWRLILWQRPRPHEPETAEVCILSGGRTTQRWCDACHEHAPSQVQHDSRRTVTASWQPDKRLNMCQEPSSFPILLQISRCFLVAVNMISSLLQHKRQ